MENIMKKYSHLLLFSGLSLLLIRNTHSACTFPSYMTGSWYDSKFVEAEFVSESVMYLNQYAITRSGSDSNLTCEMSSGNRYVLRTIDSISATISGVTGQYYYYICMDVTQITTYSFYYYLQSGVDNNGDRTVAILFSNRISSISDVCTTTISTELFHTMVRIGFESSAVQQCADPFLGDFSFSFTATTGTSGTGNLTGCTVLSTANVTYVNTPSTIKVGFSSIGYYGCIAKVVSGSTYYLSWYNFAPLIDLGANQRFSCVVATYDGNNVTASQRGRVCSSGQTSTSLPDTSALYPGVSNTHGGVLYLIPFKTCVPTDSPVSSSSSSSAAVVAVVIILLLLIIAVVVAILFYKCYYKPKKEERARKLEEQRKPKSHIGMMKTAVHAGYGGNIHKDKDDIVAMVDMEEEGIEGSITGHHPDTFKEHNNNLKLNAKFIGTSNPTTPSDIQFSDPNSVPEINLSRDKTKVTSGFSADMQGTTAADTPRSTADHNGQIPNGTISTDDKQPILETDPVVLTSAVVHTEINKLQREKSISVSDKSNAMPNNLSQGPPAEKKTTIATVNPYTEEKPKVTQDIKPVDDKKEEKLRKSVSFAADNQVVSAGNMTKSVNATLPGVHKAPNDINKTFPTNNTENGKNNTPQSVKNTEQNGAKPSTNNSELPGSVQDQSEPVISLPREPSNLMPPRETTLTQLDLTKF